jgi:hypothetical protein
VQMGTGFLSILLSQFAVQVPLYVVWVIGIVLAVVRWRRHPRVSLLLLVALVALLLTSLGLTLLRAWATHQMAGPAGWTGQQLSWFFSALGLLGVLVSAAAWGLTLFAALGWRPEPVQFPPDLPEEPVEGFSDTGIRQPRPSY